MIYYKNDNILKTKESILIHFCNCFNVMGQGLSKVISEIYPIAQEINEKTILGDKDKMGHYSYWIGNHYFYPSEKITIINAYTNYGQSKQEPLIDFRALTHALFLINKNFSKGTICLLKVKEDWNKIEKIINTIVEDRPISVYMNYQI